MDAAAPRAPGLILGLTWRALCGRVSSEERRLGLLNNVENLHEQGLTVQSDCQALESVGEVTRV